MQRLRTHNAAVNRQDQTIASANDRAAATSAAQRPAENGASAHIQEVSPTRNSISGMRQARNRRTKIVAINRMPPKALQPKRIDSRRLPAPKARPLAQL